MKRFLGVHRISPLAILPLAALAVLSCGKEEVSVDAVTPASGSARGHTTVTVKGKGFESGATVRFGATSATAVKYVSENSLEVETPGSIAGPCDVVVANPSGDEASLSSGYSYTRLALAFIDAPTSYLPDTSAWDVSHTAVADFDQDGDDDILVSCRNQPTRILTNEGKGSFVAPGSTPTGTGDGGKDGGKDGGATDGGSWPAPSFGVFTADTVRVVAADLDGDRTPDIVACNGSSQGLRIWMNSGKATFSDTKSPQAASGFTCRDVAVADLDGDGKLDIAALTFDDGESALRVFLNRGTSWEAMSGSASGPSDADAGTNGGSKDGGPSEPTTSAGVLSWNEELARIKLGDLDGDGDLDLLVARSSKGGSSYLRLLMNVAQKGKVPAFKEQVSAFSISDPVGAIALSDVDGDGDLDVFSIGAPGQDRLLINDGTGRFFDDTVATMPVDNSSGVDAIMADMDLDNRADLVIANAGAVNRLYVHATGTRMQDETPAMPLVPGHALAVVPIDIERDGDIDLFFLNAAGERSRLFVSSDTPKQ